MQYTGYSLAQEVSLDAIIAGLTGATGVEGVILSNHADFTTKNTTTNTKNTAQDGSLASLETKATGLEAGATGLEGRNATLTSDFVTLQSREDSLLAGLTGTAGATGLEERAVGFTNTITAINSNLNGEIRDQINTKVADSIFQSLKDDFEEDFTTFQNRLNQKVVTATQEVIDARQDGDDAVLEKKFCSIEEFAQTFLQTYTVAKPDGTPYNFNGKIQKVDKAPPIFSIIEKKQNGSAWDLKIKLTDYGYNVMSGNLVVKNGSGVVVNTLTKSLFNSTTKLYTLTLANSNSSGTLINGPYTFEYQASTSTAVYSLILLQSILTSISTDIGIAGSVAWGTWVGGNDYLYIYGVSVNTDGVYVTGYTNGTPAGITGTKPGGLDSFIIKLDFNGNFVWGRWIGGANTDWGYDICAASDGVYVVGISDGNISGISNTKPGTKNSGFIIKYSFTGNILWGKWIGSTTYFTGLYKVTVNSDGVYVTGAGEGSIVGITGFPPSGSYNCPFIVRYNTITGGVIWGKWIGSHLVYTSGISVDLENVYVIGYTTSNVSGVTGTRSSSGYEAFIIKYDLNGDIIWGKWIVPVNSIGGISVTSGFIYITGDIRGTFLSVSGIDGNKPGTTDDSFIIKLDLDGVIKWGKWIGGPGYENAKSISATSEGIYVSGTSDLQIIGISQSKPGLNDVFVIKFDIDGNMVWGKWFGGSNHDDTKSICATLGGVYLSGISDNTISASSGITKSTGGSNSVNTSFVIKLV